MTAAVTCFTRQGAGERVLLSDLLTGVERNETRELTNAWIKSLRLVRYGRSTMRERFTYRDDSLWWFTELYLHKVRHLEEAIATVIALDRVNRTLEPHRMLIEGASRRVVQAAEAFGRARQVALTTSEAAAGRSSDLTSYREAITAGLSRFRRARPWLGPTPRVAAFVHTAFWRRRHDGTGEESYIGPVLERVKHRLGNDGLALVGVGPARNFRARRWWDPLLRSTAGSASVTPVESFSRGSTLAGSNALWKDRTTLARELTSGPDIRTAAVVRSCDLWPVLEHELLHVASLQWPWSARVMDEAGAALDTLSPGVVVTYAEAGGWGRAIVLEARRRNIPSVGIQHGFIYRHWLNYLHEPDEIAPLNGDRGFPSPDRTLVFDAYASEHLRTHSHLPADRLVVTGNARLDDLVLRVDRLRPERDAVRLALGLPTGSKLVVLAAKFSEIRDELPRLFAAIAAQPAVHLIVKTHPAETPDAYAALASGIGNIAVQPADADLARLLAVADALVTMNSTVAVDGLVLDVPAIVLGWPTNLSPFVDAGVMVGGPELDVGDALKRVLYHQPSRDELHLRATAFTRTYCIQADGRAAERASDEILATIT